MSVGQWILRVALVTAILGGAILLTPPFVVGAQCGSVNADPALVCSGTDYVIPDVLWLPFIAIMNLGDVFPFPTLLLLITADLTITAALAGWALASWVWGKVAP